MGNRQQQSQTLETQLILRVGAKRAETKAFCREETFSTERKPRGDISGGGASLYAFIVVKTVTPADGDEASVMAVQAIMDAALPSANEA